MTAPRVKITTEPVLDPILTADVATHLRIGTTEATAESAYITALIAAARQTIERVYLHRTLIDTTYQMDLDGFEDVIKLPSPPLSSVTSVKYYDSDNALQTLDAAYYEVDTTSEPGRIIRASDYDWPDTYDRTASVQIAYICGYGDEATDVPQAIRHALLMYVGMLYENRETITELKLEEVPMAVKSLLGAYCAKGLY